jgi:hypothetical protein
MHMLYFTSFGIILTLILMRNPLRIQENIRLRWTILIVSCFGIQIGLAFIASSTQEKWESVLIITFIGIVIGLWMNRTIPGIKWILVGAGLNVLALLIYGGLMPVSETAMEIAGQDATGFESDSRHQLLHDEPFWFLADWVPIPPYVMSIGDILVGIGFIRLLSINSPTFKKVTSK